MKQVWYFAMFVVVLAFVFCFGDAKRAQHPLTTLAALSRRSLTLGLSAVGTQQLQNAQSVHWVSPYDTIVWTWQTRRSMYDAVESLPCIFAVHYGKQS